jgi:hypothetical protein
VYCVTARTPQQQKNVGATSAKLSQRKILRLPRSDSMNLARHPLPEKISQHRVAVKIATRASYSESDRTQAKAIAPQRCC